MSDKKPVIVYGASGYTGRLVCEYLREYGVPFIAAGRDAARVQEVMDKLPGIETADYEVAEVVHEVGALTELFKGAKVVCNMVGPFMHYGNEVVQAALAAGVDYLDTTGEQDWVLKCKEEYGAQFAEKGLMIGPNIAQMFTNGEIAANIALETPGTNTLDMLVMWKGLPTIASTQSIFSTLMADWFYLENNKYVPWDINATWDTPVPGQHENAKTMPWGGTANPIWFKDDPRVINCKVIGAVNNRAIMDTVIATKTMVVDEIRPLPPKEQEAALAQIASQAQAQMPPRERTMENTSLDSVYATGPMARSHVVLHGTCNYKQTGLLQAYIAMCLLQQRPNKLGFASACHAFNYRDILGQMQAFGLMMKPIVTVHD